MHGLGNDYVYLDAVAEPALADRGDLPDLARAVSDRRFGVGSDGLIVVSRPSDDASALGAQVRMRMFNADGSEGEMCGNGIRCVAKLVVDRGHAQPDDNNALLIETGRGVLRVVVHREGHEDPSPERKRRVSEESSIARKEEQVAEIPLPRPLSQGERGEVAFVTVDMGAPILEPSRIPVDLSKLEPAGRHDRSAETPGLGTTPLVHDQTHSLQAWLVEGLPALFVSMGNPHMVSFVETPVQEFDLARLGPACERHPAFPNRINVHIVNAKRRDLAVMRTWERGSGLTLACGTGACATLVSGVLLGQLDREATLRLPGGELRIRWDEHTDHVFMTGPAVEVFQGRWFGSV